MDFIVFTGFYVLVLLLVVAALLFGQNRAFARTPLPKIHWLLTDGIWSTAGAAVRRMGGRRGGDCLQAAGDLCCERSNPAVQIIFLVLLAGCYWLFCAYIFPLLPLPGVPAWHIHTGSAAALACLALFLLASFGDPGTVTAANLEAHRSLYPYDGLLYVEKDCWTCSLPRPARSKHCRACGRCVARMDHHCIWLNNCVGLLNMRWFLAFLVATAAVCFYAAVLGFRVLRSDMAHRDVWNTAFLHPQTEQVVYLGDSWRVLLLYMSAAYGPEVAVVFFTAFAGLIVLGFLGYQLYLICTGVTTTEVFKRQDLAEQLQLDQEVAQLEARVEAQLASGRQGAAGGGAGGLEDGSSTAAGAAAAGNDTAGGNDVVDGAQHGADAEQQRKKRRAGRHVAAHKVPIPNHYHRGAWCNLSEVLFPRYHLRLAATQGAGNSNSSGGSGGKKRA